MRGCRLAVVFRDPQRLVSGIPGVLSARLIPEVCAPMRSATQMAGSLHMVAAALLKHLDRRRGGAAIKVVSGPTESRKPYHGP